ncbi:hypothetical protein KL905_001050 [Ogataea polymorpha]|uniref:C2H2-type domain-containing protein n=2 Tax=Ogataea polymorpha TaxID=460523 RepID=A0A9P8TDC4_9ASCO|nr:hypothetical protein KL936_001895 [Ogataea polymorpha]KAG7901713.1 hypothetical protein KL935_001673 [Ogataea polymorpha]KAG7910231.1 hypothetical protein KL907_001122 [Ogataea polymorpha]KAG7910747.1 hypothetical protein KL906_001127 [Ogataea polymorpha]KAG7923832.1 hypothetical protein KL905_001050 [Ogataea polymorpha]
MSLEEKRAILEDLDRMEHAITTRFCKFPELYQPLQLERSRNLSSSKESKAKTVLLRLEIKRFLDRRRFQTRKLVSLLHDKDHLHTLREFDDCYIRLSKKHDRLLHLGLNANDVEKEELDKYALYSSDKGDTCNRRRLLSSYARDLQLSSIFGPKEALGEILDLSENFKEWLNLPKKQSFYGGNIPSYTEYLSVLTKFDCETYDKDSVQYKTYIKNLAEYLSNFYIKTRPLNRPEIDIERIRQSFSSALIGDGDNVYCLVCQKDFAKLSVFNSHLKGKKHKKAVSRPGTYEVALNEHMVMETIKLLKKELENTKKEAERYSSLSFREKEFETNDAKNLSDYEYENIAELHNDHKLDGHEELHHLGNDEISPIGPDGKPMPLWLWKLKGFDMVFTCEICGNVKFKGKEVFQNHFTEPRHLHGLKMLGVMGEYNAFRDLDKIDDVLELSNYLEKKQRNDAQYKDDGVEVEDEEGNVMSRKVYEQLKKQGLI